MSDDSLFYPFRANADNPRAAEAEAYFRKAYEYQMQGKLPQAEEYYRKSIEAFPTAEAYTFLGWVYSFQGRLEEAIQLCHKAIEIDPAFGNPYNDIGAYLIELGRPDEAIPWLHKAMQAERYEPKHFPHINMARVFLLKGMYFEAMQELRRALEIDPSNPGARRELRRLRARLN